MSLESRFFAKVDKDGPVIRPEFGACWKWKAAKTEHGYGVIGRGGRGEGVLKAPRASWEIHFGPIADGLVVCHRCDNPECTNPDHLFLGTMKENVDDMVAKRRHAHGEQASYARLTEQQVSEIRASSEPERSAAARYGVSRSMIGLIRRGERWGHLSRGAA